MRRCHPLLIAVTLCLFGGVIATAVVAIAGAFWGPQSHSFEFSDQLGMIDKALREQCIERISQRPVIVMSTFGLGYRSLGSWFTKPADTNDMPDEVSTVVGWPNFVIRTNCRMVSERMFAGSRRSLTGNTHVLPGTRILWSGVCFDSLLFAALILGVGSCLGWRLLAGCRLVSGVVCAGLWLTLVIAWGCDLAHQAQIVPRGITGFSDPAVFSAEVHSIAVPNRDEWTLFAGRVTKSLGYCEWSAVFIKADASNAQTAVLGQTQMSLGWPMTALRGPSAGAWSVNGDQWPAETRYNHIMRLLATPVWWPGFLVNWLIYSLLILGVVRGPSFLRRIIRLRSDRCTACGYILKGLDRCPECGTPARISRQSSR